MPSAGVTAFVTNEAIIVSPISAFLAAFSKLTDKSFIKADSSEEVNKFSVLREEFVPFLDTKVRQEITKTAHPFGQTTIHGGEPTFWWGEVSC